MTPKEAIEILEEIKELDDTLYAYSNAYMEALEVALYALKEIQNYRKLGTLEELARAKKYIDLSKRHGTIGEMIDECAEYEAIGTVEQVRNQKDNLAVAYKIIDDYESCGTVEECREAVEKQKPKKPVLRNDNGKLRKSCPVCGCFFSPLSRSCPKCGQAIL